MQEKKEISKKGLKSKKIFLVCSLIVLFLVFLICDLLIIRHLTARQIDDVNPSILCGENRIASSSTLMIVPIFNGISIADNMTWCNSILSLNKTLGMHGVYHTYNEFLELRNESYISRGMDEFKKCFGYYPEYFEAPQLALSSENVKILEEMGFDIRGWLYMITHKVYHCQDTGIFAINFGKIKITNRFIDFV